MCQGSNRNERWGNDEGAVWIKPPWLNSIRPSRPAVVLVGSTIHYVLPAHQYAEKTDSPSVHRAPDNNCDRFSLRLRAFGATRVSARKLALGGTFNGLRGLRRVVQVPLFRHRQAGRRAAFAAYRMIGGVCFRACLSGRRYANTSPPRRFRLPLWRR